MNPVADGVTHGAQAFGLTASEAAARLQGYGPNRVEEPKRHPAIALLAKFSGPVPWMLEVSLLLEAFLRKWIEAAIIGMLLVLNAVLAFSQEQRAHNALLLLRQRLAVMARARRDERWTQVRAEEIVPGDVIHVRMGDLVPADLRLLDGGVLLDLSSLTGESAPAEVRAGDPAYSGSAIEEAAAMDVLCSDKTGTLTQNRLSLAAAQPQSGTEKVELLRLASFACDEATQDPLDLAILRALAGEDEHVHRLQFVPFDPATKRAEAVVRRGGQTIRVVKGAPQAVATLAGNSEDFDRRVEELAATGHRVLAVAAGPEGHLRLAGLLGFIDPPRDDSAALLTSLRDLGVRVIMVTGDAAATARAVANQLGIGARVCNREAVANAVDCDVLAGVLPEDKYQFVQALQGAGHVVGMTGDGVNDAPALKQAEVGIAVESAADVAKAAASIVLTKPGLAGIVAAVETGRRIYQRMLTYTLNKIVKTIEIALFLSICFFVTGALVTSPRLILLLLLTNDFVTMSIARDRVSFSPKPDRWNVVSLVLTSAGLAVAWLAFSLGALLFGQYVIHLAMPSIQTLAFLALVFGGQANVYLVRERRRFWRSRPSLWMLGATTGDLLFVTALAGGGVLMAPVAPRIIATLLVAALAFMAVLDAGKVLLLRSQVLTESTVASTAP